MNLKGTNFQLKVWNYLRKIPKGKVNTYLEVAKAIGKPKAFRAVANAVGKTLVLPKYLAIELSDLMAALVATQEKVVFSKKGDY